MDRFVLGHDETSIQPASATTTEARGSQESEFFAHSVDELSARLLDAAITAVSVSVPQMREEHKLKVVAELERRGFFLIRQSAETAAYALGVTRFHHLQLSQRAQRAERSIGLKQAASRVQSLAC